MQNQGPEAKETDPGVITIWTEGSCLGNPGPGGWAYVRQDGGGVLAVASGGEPDTTIARMEMQAVIEALKALPQRRFPIVLYSGSQPLVRTVVEGEKWKRRTNPDLWEELDRVAGGLRLLWKWTRGNKGEPEIERCRRLAEAAAIHQARVGVPPD